MQNGVPLTSALLTEKEAAAYLRRSLASMRRDRYAGIGPAFVRIGRSVRYQLSALDEFLSACTVQTLGSGLEVLRG
jgi:hypothetical protein